MGLWKVTTIKYGSASLTITKWNLGKSRNDNFLLNLSFSIHLTFNEKCNQNAHQLRYPHFAKLVNCPWQPSLIILPSDSNCTDRLAFSDPCEFLTWTNIVSSGTTTQCNFAINCLMMLLSRSSSSALLARLQPCKDWRRQIIVKCTNKPLR